MANRMIAPPMIRVLVNAPGFVGVSPAPGVAVTVGAVA